MMNLFFKSIKRNLFRKKHNSFLNIGGLTIALVAFLYITIHVVNEKSFDKFHANADRIYRVCTDFSYNSTEEKLADVNPPFAEFAVKELPEIESAVRAKFHYDVIVSFEQTSFIEDQIIFVDSNFFDFFDFELLIGDKKSVFDNLHSVVISKTAAEKYFGKASPVGKTLLIDEEKSSYVVAGIMKDMPRNSHLQSDIIIPFKTYPLLNNPGWNNWGNWDGVYTYFRIAPNVDLEVFQNKLAEFPQRFYGQMFKDNLGISMEQFAAQGNHVFPFLQPLNEIYLETELSNDLPIKGSARMLNILQIIGILILVIACINFTNISTALSNSRGKEIGVKKIIGSGKKSIVLQLLAESFILCGIAVLIAVLLFYFLVPVLNGYTQLEVRSTDLLNKSVLLVLVLLPVFLALFTGAYPAFLIARLNPVNVLKTKELNTNKGKWMRGSLVSFQFLIFLGLIICTITIQKQIHLVHNSDTGFSKQNLLVINNTNQFYREKEAFKQELLRKPEIEQASYSSFFEGGNNPFGYVDSPENFLMDRMTADGEFLNTYNIELIEGRYFKDDVSSDGRSVLINESADRLLAWDNCKDKYIKDYSKGGEYKVIGVVKDFHRFSFRLGSRPLVIQPENTMGDLVLKVSGNDISKVLAGCEETWKQFESNAPFSYTFVDERLNSYYQADERIMKILFPSTALAIIIACLGLFGLVAFTANKRVKEIGVRKVNGAKITEILGLLNKDFIQWVVIALILSWPISWLVMQKYLQSFSVKTSMSWWVFLLSGFLGLLITFITVSFQSWRAASRNPVEALRDE